MGTDPSKTFEDYEVSETYETKGRTATESDIRLFIGATDSTHRNHVDHEYCDQHPVFDGVAVQGVLTLGVADAFVADAVSKDAILALNYGHDSVRYLEPVYPGDTISGTIEITDTDKRDNDWGIVTMDVTLVNQDDVDVLYESHLMLIATADNPNAEELA